MNIYKIDSELGIVYKRVEGVWHIVTKLSNFKLPKDSKVSYFTNKAVGE